MVAVTPGGTTARQDACAWVGENGECLGVDGDIDKCQDNDAKIPVCPSAVVGWDRLCCCVGLDEKGFDFVESHVSWHSLDMSNLMREALPDMVQMRLI
jgi:hypothetical protein